MTKGRPKTASRLAAMLRRATKPLLVLVSTALIAGCGSDEPGTIPDDNANVLIDLVNAVEEAVAEGDCEAAQQNADEFETAVDNLPAEVDDEVKDGLRQAGDRMAELSREPDQCDSESGATGPDGAEDEEEPSTPTTTEEEPVAPPETTEEEPTEEEEPQQEENQTDNGGDNTSPNPGGGNTTPPSGEGNPPEVDIEPGTDSGGVVPGEGRTP